MLILVSYIGGWLTASRKWLDPEGSVPILCLIENIMTLLGRGERSGLAVENMLLEI